MPCAWALSPAAAGRWRPGPCRPARGTLVSGPGGYSCLGGRGARPSLPRVSQIPRLKGVSGQRCSPAPRGLMSQRGPCTSGREAAAAPPSLATSPRAGGRGGVPTRGVPETSQRGNVLSVARGKGPRGQRPLPGATVQRLVPRTGWGCRGRGAPRCLCGREPRASEATFPISCALRSID